MLKSILLATAMTVAVPALAQTAGLTGAAPADSTMSTQTDSTTSATAPNDSAATTSTTKSSKSKRSSSASPQGTMTTDTTTATTATTATDPGQPPAADGNASQTASATATATPGADAAKSQPTAGVGSVVDQEFASYDKNGDGQLNKTEFSAWLDALKAQQPANAAAMKDPAYNAKAFAQADTDKSAALSKGEVTTFLSGGKASS